MPASNDTSGIPQAVFSVMFLVEISLVAALQCLTLPIFVLFADYRSRSSHRIMLCIGLFDLFQLFPYLALCICATFDFQMPNPMERFFGALNLVAWDALIMEDLLLAANRALTIIKPHFSPTLHESEWEQNAYKVLNIAIWLWTVCFMALFLTPLLGSQIFYDCICYDYDSQMPFVPLYQTVEFVCAMTAFGVSFCLYVVIIAFVKKNKFKTSTFDVAPRNNNNHNHRPSLVAIDARERRILVQAILLFVGIAALELSSWWWSNDFNQAMDQLYDVCYMAYCGLNPVLYFCLNQDFRKRFLCLYGFRKEAPPNCPQANVVHARPCNNQPRGRNANNNAVNHSSLPNIHCPNPI